MIFNSIKEVELYLKYLRFLNIGGQSTCYLRKSDNMVIKIGLDFQYEEYCNMSEYDIMKFNNIKNDTFIWATDIVKIKDRVIGYILPYVPSKNLYACNPLTINLDHYENSIVKAKKDINIISKAGIKTFDVPYNILYGNRINIIDHLDYSLVFEYNKSKLAKYNNSQFDDELYMFLIESYFDEFVENDNELSQLYKDRNEDVLVFLQLLRKKLSNIADKKISTLGEAKKCLNKNKHEPKYFRTKII